ncbi:MAG: sigma-70 family RNA polymerase sigma factor [Cyclobacteriaceae bacterium]
MHTKKRHFIQVINESGGIIRSLCKVYYERSEDQEDAFQDIILQLWKSFETFGGRSMVSTWIYRVALNTILNKKRREQKSVSAEPIALSHIDNLVVRADDDLELLHLIIHSLRDLDKAIVILYLEGYHHKEIAEILKITPTNVATRFNRLKERLKSKFNSNSHATR